MKSNYIKETVLSLLVVLSAVLLINPFMFWMPTAFDMMIVVFALLFLALIGVTWKESAGDEREDAHKFMAGRMAYLAGSGVIVLGIVVEALRHAVDPWLVAALAVMVLAKVVALVYRNKVN